MNDCGSYGKFTAMTDIADRIKHIRNLAGMNQAEFGQSLKVSRGAVWNWELGRGIKRENLISIAHKFGVDVGWLLDEDGKRPESLTDPLSQRRGSDSAVERSASGRKTTMIAEIDARAGAGGGGIPIDGWIVDRHGNQFTAEGIRDHWEIPQTVMQELLHAPAHHVRAFEVVGDSMEPRLSAGDRVFVDLRYTIPSPEGIFVLWDGYGIVVKRVQIIRGSEPLRVRVISDNAQYEPYDAAIDEIQIIGRYVGRFTIN